MFFTAEMADAFEMLLCHNHSGVQTITMEVLMQLVELGKIFHNIWHSADGINSHVAKHDKPVFTSKAMNMLVAKLSSSDVVVRKAALDSVFYIAKQGGPVCD